MTSNFLDKKRDWSSGRIYRCHRCDPGSIPGSRTYFSNQVTDVNASRRRIHSEMVTRRVSTSSSLPFQITAGTLLRIQKVSNGILGVLLYSNPFISIATCLIPTSHNFMTRASKISSQQQVAGNQYSKNLAKII